MAKIRELEAKISSLEEGHERDVGRLAAEEKKTDQAVLAQNKAVKVRKDVQGRLAGDVTT